jgi:hypothetical protein
VGGEQGEVSVEGRRKGKERGGTRPEVSRAGGGKWRKPAEGVKEGEKRGEGRQRRGGEEGANHTTRCDGHGLGGMYGKVRTEHKQGGERGGQRVGERLGQGCKCLGA